MTSAHRDVAPSSVEPGIVLEVRDIKKDFVDGREVVHAVRGVSLTVRVGELVAIMGASGSGKSTLLHLLGGLDAPSGGSIHIEGQDLRAMSDRERTLFRRRRLGFVFQAYNLLPTLSALENVALPAQLESGDRRSQGGQVNARAGELLDRVDLAHRQTHRPQALSGGEQQRVAIARALMNDPVLLFADEPTGNLDTHHGEAIWRLLVSLVRDGQRTVLVVTHEAQGAAFADRILVMKDGRIVGQIEPGGEGDADVVASRYRELVG